MTRHVYCPIMPLDLELVKEGDTGIHVNGGNVAERAIVENILRFSRQDVFLFPRQAITSIGDLRRTRWVNAAGNRVRFVNSLELMRGALSRDMILFSPAWGMDHLVTLRDSIGRKTIPLVSVSHSLCSPSVMAHFKLLYLSGMRSHDSFVVPSTAGHIALLKMWAHAGESVASQTDPSQLECPLFRVIPHGIDEEYFSGSASSNTDHVRFLYFGRFSTQSKADLVPLLVAWASLKKKIANISLKIAGDDTQQKSAERLREVAMQLGCGDSVEVITNPTKRQKHEMYHEADVFLSPSDSLQETFGLTLLEAMAAGLPVIVSDWSGYKDIVEEGNTGFLIPTIFPAMPPARSSQFSEPFLSDISAVATSVDVGCLVDRMFLLATRGDLRRSLGDQGRRKAAEQYGWKRIVEMYDDLFDHLREESKRFQDRESKTRANAISPSTVFSHYPTMNLQETMRVSRKDGGQREYVLSLACHGYPDAAALVKTLESIPRTAISVRELCSLMEIKAGVERREVFLHVGRLMKYDLIVYLEQ